MKFTEQKQAEVLSTGVEDSIEMDIDLSDKKFLMGLFTEGIYKDSMGSICREYSANSLDASREAGVDEPVIVRIRTNDLYQYILEFIDFGTGISPERMQNTISKYFASTRRNSDLFIGGYGLGMKSGMSYVDSFTIHTNYEGIKYRYIMYKSEEGVAIDLLHEEETTDRNGTTIEIPIKDYYDRKTFIEKIREQLAYFEKVYFEVEGINNDFKIIRHTDWKYSELANASTMHLCLDNCYYAIDYSKLGINAIYCPIALNFELGGHIFPTPSREDCKYTPAAKKAILDKIKVVATYFAEKYNEANVQREHVFEIWRKFEKEEKEVEIEGVTFNISDLLPYTEVELCPPSVVGVDKIDLKRFIEKSDRILYYFDYKGEIEWRGKGRVYSTKGFADPKRILNMLRLGKKVILASGDAIPKLKMDYIKDSINECIIVRRTAQKRPLMTKGLKSSYYNLLKLHEVPKSEWREMIKQYQLLEESIVDKMIRLEDIVPSEQWLEDRARNRKKSSITVVQKVEINPKWGYCNSFGDYSYKIKEPILISSANTDLVIWGTPEDKEDLSRLNSVLGGALKTAILTIRDIKRVTENNINNWHNIKNYMNSKHELFTKFCTAYKLRQFRSRGENRVIFGNLSFIRDVDESLGDKLIKANDYISDNIKNGQYDSDLSDEMLKLAEENDLMDTEMTDLLQELEAEIPKLDFLEYMKIADKYSKQIDNNCLPLAIEIYTQRKNQQVYAETTV